MSCFLCSTHVRHFGSKSANQRKVTKLTVTYAVRMSAILNQTAFENEPMTREEQNLDPFHSEALH